MKPLPILVLLFCASLAHARQNSCEPIEWSSVQFTLRTYPIQKISSAVLFRAGMLIDADGAPNAYAPDDRGLDSIENAKDGERMNGIVLDDDGNPVVQQSGPFKGFYVSPTALYAAEGSRTDPTTYVDATRIPYIVLPPEFRRQFGVSLGDLALVTNMKNGKSAFAIFAYIGPHDQIGEGSIALANALGLDSNPRYGGIEEPIISYLVFPKSGLGQGKLPTLEMINASASQVFEQWGGAERLNSCNK